MMKLDWNQLRAFHATAQTGSLSAAARQLGLTQPTLSRQIAALEADLGMALFDRQSRRLVITQTGRELLAHIGTMGDAAASLALAASGHSQEISGQVRISATDSFSAYILPDILARIRKAAPRLSLVVVATNTYSNLHQMEADIAIRHAKPDQPSLIGQHIGNSYAHFYAAESWVARHGMPDSPAEVDPAALIGFGDSARLADYLRKLGFAIRGADFALASDSAVVVWEMVKRGMGIAAMPREVAAMTPGLVTILPQLAPVPVPIWLVSHREVQTSPRIQLVQRILAEELCPI